MTVVSTPQTRCRVGVARRDITPPAGIYHRMWGAAMHDRAEGVHKPLLATLLLLDPVEPAVCATRVVISLDHCILDGREIAAMRHAIARAIDIDPAAALITVSHTHGSGWMSRERAALPGGDLIGPYLDSLVATVAEMAREARASTVPATIVYGLGRCDLAAHRDFTDPQTGQFVCGFNPDGHADDTILVARITDFRSAILATMVNYACHPTTLAWDNRLISPDWVGAMRDLVENATHAPCLFLQGASGDLGPRRGFVGDTSVADRNGKQVGHAALAVLESLPSAGTEFRYVGPVISGTRIGTWADVPVPDGILRDHAKWHWKTVQIDLPYRHDLPSVAETTELRDLYVSQEMEARQAGDMARVRDCRASAEQMNRQLTRLNVLVPGQSYPLSVTVGLVGDAYWVFVPGELYQVFQETLRERFAPHPVVVITMTGDWQPGYIPPASTYGYGIYQEVIAATAPGCLEILIETVCREMKALAI
jgi:hypothetical protein